MKIKIRKVLVIVIVILILVVSNTSCKKKSTVSNSSAEVVAGFVYAGSLKDSIYAQAHDTSKDNLLKQFSWLGATYVDSASASNVASSIDNLITKDKCKIIFTTSSEFLDSILALTKKYPDVIFENYGCKGTSDNCGSYFAELYQTYYLTGLMAGALTKTNKIGFIAEESSSTAIRYIDAFAIGVKEVNINARIYVSWLPVTFDSYKVKSVAESLISNGADVLASMVNSTAVVDVGESYTKKGQQIYTFSYFAPMLANGPDTVVSGQLANLTQLYQDILVEIRTGIWKSEIYWKLMNDNCCTIGADFNTPVNPKFVDGLKNKIVVDPVFGRINVYDLVLERQEQMSEEAVLFDPFTGPIKDQNGILRLKSGERASFNTLQSIDWLLDNVVGEIPKQ